MGKVRSARPPSAFTAAAAERRVAKAGVAKAAREGGDASGAARAAPARWSKEQKRAAASQPRRREAAAEPSPPPRDASPAPAGRRRGASPSQHGSHFAHGETGMVNDEWQTTAEAWADVAPILLPKFADQCCWQPFYYDGACAKHLRSLGFRKVVHENADFFQKVADKQFLAGVDFIWCVRCYACARWPY